MQPVEMINPTVHKNTFNGMEAHVLLLVAIVIQLHAIHAVGARLAEVADDRGRRLVAGKVLLTRDHHLLTSLVSKRPSAVLCWQGTAWTSLGLSTVAGSNRSRTEGATNAAHLISGCSGVERIIRACTACITVRPPAKGPQTKGDHGAYDRTRCALTDRAMASVGYARGTLQLDGCCTACACAFEYHIGSSGLCNVVGRRRNNKGCAWFSHSASCAACTHCSGWRQQICTSWGSSSAGLLKPLTPCNLAASVLSSHNICRAPACHCQSHPLQVHSTDAFVSLRPSPGQATSNLVKSLVSFDPG